MHGSDVGIPEGLDYTVAKPVFDTIDSDLTAKVMSNRRPQGSDIAQNGQTSKDFETGGLNLQKSNDPGHGRVEYTSTLETQGSTQARDDCRQLRNMVASFTAHLLVSR
jgi:hypothetical protein